jgi:hypothetical protein
MNATANRTAKSPKAAYHPHVKLVNRDRGLFEVSSESCDIVLYDVDLNNGRCSCLAGRNNRHCKHIDACNYVSMILCGRNPNAPKVTGYSSLTDAFAS